MKNQMAIDVLNRMRRDGLDPTPEDVIRLNALGLKCGSGSRAADFRALPRTAYLGKLVLREPAIGHGEWLDRFLKEIDSSDVVTVFIAAAFALSRGVDELPPIDKLNDCVKTVRKFSKCDLKNFTFAQLKTAVEYAVVGVDPSAQEHAPDEEAIADDESIHVGLLWQTVSLGLGLSVADVRKMTSAEIMAVQELAFARLGIDVAKSSNTTSIGRFNDAVAEIRERLEKEKKNG